MARKRRTADERVLLRQGPRARLFGGWSTVFGVLALLVLMVALWEIDGRDRAAETGIKSRLGESIARYLAGYRIGRRR